MNEQAAQTATEDLSSAPLAAARRRGGESDNGIDVREEELVFVQAQRMYQMRCECGRSWFELVAKQLVQCPACHKLGLVAAYTPRRPAAHTGRRK